MLLTVNDMSKSYRKGQPVLRNVNVSLGAGEIVGLVGESGSGKSTLARLIMQLEPSESGSVIFDGLSITKHKKKAFYKECQIIFQNASAALNPSWTVKEILMEPLRDKKINRDQHIQKMLTNVGLSKNHLTQRPSELSGGERQRVNLLRSILVNPRLLICDEIVSDLDRLIQREIIDLLIELNHKTGMAILFISHDLQIVEYLCSRIYVMKNGEVIDEIAKTENGLKLTNSYSVKLFGNS